MGGCEMSDVRAFNARHGLLVNDAPTHVTKTKLSDQLEIMTGKLRRFADATHEQDMVGQAETLVEFVYAAKSTAAMLGLPWRALWGDMHKTMSTPYGKNRHIARSVEILQQAGYDRAAFAHPSRPGVIDERFCDNERATRLVP